MKSFRPLSRDPRAVARDIPGIFDVLFPQLAPSVVMHFNRGSYAIDGCSTISSELIGASSLQHAMLFEIAVAGGQQLIQGSNVIDLDNALEVATIRQRRHFDAEIPEELTDLDKYIATLVAENLAKMLGKLSAASGTKLANSPPIPGYQWIASGNGDFAIGTRLIEVKCTNKPFSSSDYRQVVMYWLLSYASSVEGGPPEWSDAMLVNPRINKVVEISFDHVIKVIGAGRTKVDLLELFSSMVADHNLRLLAHL